MLNFKPLPNKQGYTLERAKVFGGWLVREMHDVLHINPNYHSLQPGYEWRSTLTFIPDPSHTWEAYEKLVA